MNSYIVTIVTDGHQTVLNYRLNYVQGIKEQLLEIRGIAWKILFCTSYGLFFIWFTRMMRDANIYGQLFQYRGCWNQCDLSVLGLTPSNFLDMKSYPVYRECIIYRMNRNLSAIYLTIYFQDRRGAASLCYLTIIPRARMGSESMRARGIIVLVKSN